MATFNDHNNSSTPYDDAFRTLVTKSGRLVIPFLNELFKSDQPIPSDAQVFNEVNEQFLNTGNGSQEKTATDSVIIISNNVYHIECQSLDDNTILIRIAKYDWMVGVKRSIISNNDIDITFPYSGVLYLRKTAKTPDHLSIHYHAANGDKMDYSVKVLVLADYTLDDLIEKNLLFLFPFYLFNLEDELKSYNTKEESREKIISSYNELLNYLNDLYNSKELSNYHYHLIVEMLQKVTDGLAKNQENAKEELDQLMGGKVLRLKIDDVYEEGIERGIEKGEKKGREEAKLQSIEHLMKSTGWNAQKAMDALGIIRDEQPEYLTKIDKKESSR